MTEEEIRAEIQKNTDELYEQIMEAFNKEFNHPTEATNNGIIRFEYYFISPVFFNESDNTRLMKENNDSKHDEQDMLFYANVDDPALYIPVNFGQLACRINDNELGIEAHHSVVLSFSGDGFLPKVQLIAKVKRSVYEYSVGKARQKKNNN